MSSAVGVLFFFISSNLSLLMLKIDIISFTDESISSAQTSLSFTSLYFSPVVDFQYGHPPTGGKLRGLFDRFRRGNRTIGKDLLTNTSSRKENATIDFDTFSVNHGGYAGLEIRRLSTQSWRAPVQRRKLLQTEWRWFWLDNDDSWLEYRFKGHDSAALESLYAEDPNGLLPFSSDQFEYELDLSKMAQTNCLTGGVRKVRRRPSLVTPSNLQEKKMAAALQESVDVNSPDDTPAKWARDVTYTNGYCRVPINRDGPTAADFSEIKNLVLSNLLSERVSGVTVESIERIQNPEALDQFESKKKWMIKKSSSPGTSVERRLYHGTRQQYIEAICQQGFDFRVSGMTTGCRFGKGSYFSVSAKYSLHYTDSKQLFVVRVLTRDYTTGHSSFTRLPPKDPQNPAKLFDSCVDKIPDPSMFIVFDLHYSYPEYLMQFRY